MLRKYKVFLTIFVLTLWHISYANASDTCEGEVVVNIGDYKLMASRSFSPKVTTRSNKGHIEVYTLSTKENCDKEEIANVISYTASNWGLIHRSDTELKTSLKLYESYLEQGRKVETSDKKMKGYETNKKGRLNVFTDLIETYDDQPVASMCVSTCEVRYFIAENTLLHYEYPNLSDYKKDFLKADKAFRKKLAGLGLSFKSKPRTSTFSKVLKSLSPQKPVELVSFMIVDLEDDGIDYIPLEESKVLFDVDGDGLAERVQWITPKDAFVFSYTREGRGEGYVKNKMLYFFTNHRDKLIKYDKDSNLIYDEHDFLPYRRGEKYQDLSLVFAKDENLDGLPETHRKNMIKCYMRSVEYSALETEKKITIHCKDKTYTAYETIFEYEDINVRWDKMCDISRDNSRFDNPDSYLDFQKSCIETKDKP